MSRRTHPPRILVSGSLREPPCSRFPALEGGRRLRHFWAERDFPVTDRSALIAQAVVPTAIAPMRRASHDPA